MRKRRAEYFTFKRRGMTLVELLITLIIGGIIMGSVSLLFVAFFRNFNMHDDLAAAQQNAEMGLSLIETYVLQAGMGMPSNSAEFRNAFKIGPTPFPEWTGVSWTGPVSPDGVAEALEVLTARDTVPAVGAMEEKVISPSATSLKAMANPSFSGGASLAGLVSQNDWVVFPASRLPFRVTANPSTNTELQLECSSSDTVQIFDTLYVLEKVYFYVDDGNLFMDTLNKPKQDTGISVFRMYVYWNSNTSLLQVVLLARGKEKMNHQFGLIPGWPGRAITGNDLYYRYVAVGRIWRIRN